MKKVYAFDFDGTLTTCDTLIAFIRHAKGTAALLWALLLHSPLLIAMKLHLYDNGRTKERLLSWFFKGTSIQEFETLCLQFAADNRHLLRPEGLAAIEKALAAGVRVVVVSASVENWVRPFFSDKPEVEITGTRMEVVDGRLTGSFDGRNCYGQEKVNRLNSLFGNRTDFFLEAFGDSNGDKELLAYADKQHYKPFRSKGEKE